MIYWEYFIDSLIYSIIDAVVVFVALAIMLLAFKLVFKYDLKKTNENPIATSLILLAIFFTFVIYSISGYFANPNLTEQSGNNEATVVPL